jgi:DMSO/TMAO reductase YedYZ molybdopterin-dependent catalytic subunit
VAKLISRREMLGAVAASTILAGCNGPRTAKFLSGMERWNARFQEVLFSPSRLAPEPPESEVTDDDDFPSYFVSDMMPFAPANWTLKVGGLVDKPAVFTLDQLKHMPRFDQRIRHHCVEGWSAVASWQGVRVSDIAKAVGLKPGARFVEFRSFDSGYYSSWDMPSAMHPQTILAYGMNGDDLEADHGAPLRLYSAVKLGYKNVKYLTEVNFLPVRTGGYWENQGYEWFAGT